MINSFDERLYATRIVGALLRAAEDEEHVLFELAKDMLSKILGESPAEGNAFAVGLIVALEKKTSQELPDFARNNTRYQSLWAKQGLREQVSRPRSPADLKSDELSSANNS